MSRWRAALVAVVAVASAVTTSGAASSATASHGRASVRPVVQRALQQTPAEVVEALRLALREEAEDAAKYAAYRRQALQENLPDPAALLRRASITEIRDHVAQLLRELEQVRGNAANLRDAIAGEREEARHLYPSFTAQARRQGDTVAADRFTELAGDEASHLANFETALAVVLHQSTGRIPDGPSVKPVHIQPGPPRSSGQTLQNERTVMQGEASAWARYTYYGRHALRHGDRALARLFFRTARVEREEHFAEMATLAGALGDTETNLRRAVADETRDAKVTFPRYARLADRLGDESAARVFREIARGDAALAHALRHELRELERDNC